MKKICIVSDVIGNRDVIKDKFNGFVANNIEKYKKTIEEISREKSNIEYIKGNMEKTVMEDYNINETITNYKRFY